MLATSALLPILVVLVGVASATDFYITSPYSSVSWKAGETVKITWNVIAGGSDVSSVQVDLMDGDDNNAKVVMPIASNISPSTTAIDWQVPVDFPKTPTVFVRVRGQGSAGIVDRYSHRFLIDSSQSPAQAKPAPAPVKSESKVQQQAATTISATLAGVVSSSVLAESSLATNTTETTTSDEHDSTEKVPTASATIMRRRSNDAASVRSAVAGGLLIAVLVAAGLSL